MRGVRKYAMRRERAVRPVDGRGPGAVRNMHMRCNTPSPADPRVRDMGSAAGATDMRREVQPTNSSMRGNMRDATDMRSEMRPSTTRASSEMRDAPANVWSEMRRTASHVRSTADVRSPTRMSATRMSAASTPRRRRSGASHQAQAQADGGDAHHNSSRSHHNVSSTCTCARRTVRRKPLQTKRRAVANGSGRLAACRSRKCEHCTHPRDAALHSADARNALDCVCAACYGCGLNLRG